MKDASGTETTVFKFEGAPPDRSRTLRAFLPVVLKQFKYLLSDPVREFPDCRT